MEQAQDGPQTLRDEIAAAMRNVHDMSTVGELATELSLDPAAVAVAAGLSADDCTTTLTPEQVAAVRRAAGPAETPTAEASSAGC